MTPDERLFWLFWSCIEATRDPLLWGILGAVCVVAYLSTQLGRAASRGARSMVLSNLEDDSEER